MDTKLKVLGVVGARSGSKGIPGKNIKSLFGKPLMAWIIEVAKASKYVTRLILSTDSQEYAEVGKKYGAEIPFLRPPELAKDSVPDFDFLYHAATWMCDNADFQADVILRLPPTSPLCKTEHIDACVELLMKHPEADSSRTVISAGKHPYKMWRANGPYIEPFLPESFHGLKDAHNLPRQSFPKAFNHVDVIALRWNTLVNQRAMAGEKVLFHEINKNDAADIDTETDFIVAEELLKRRLQI